MPSRVRDTYVGMFDILGFKALRSAKGTAAIAQLYERSLLAMVQHAAAGASKKQIVGGEEVLVPHFTTTSVSYRVISDTVIFFARDDSFTSFYSIVHAAYNLMLTGFGNGQTPFRGAIGFGDLYDHHEITVGSGIEDAHRGEAAQLWAGTMFTDKATEHARTAGYFDQWIRVHNDAAARQSDKHDADAALLNAKQIAWYDVPLKPDGEARYAPVIDWTLRMFAGAVEKALPISTDARATTIRDNTLAFERWARGRR